MLRRSPRVPPEQRRVEDSQEPDVIRGEKVGRVVAVELSLGERELGLPNNVLVNDFAQTERVIVRAPSQLPPKAALVRPRDQLILPCRHVPVQGWKRGGEYRLRI